MRVLEYIEIIKLYKRSQPFSILNVLGYLFPKQSNSVRFLRPCYHYYQRYISPAATKIRKHLFKCLSMSIVTIWPTKMISRSPHMFISRLFTSCVFLFRMPFQRTIRDILTVFVSDFGDSARSMTNLDIWLAVLLLLLWMYLS